MVHKAHSIEWEATGIQIPFFGCGLKQINSDSTFYFVCGPLPLPPISHPSRGLTPFGLAPLRSAAQRGINSPIGAEEAVLLGEQKATASATALVAKSAVRGAEARCFLVRPVGS